MLNITILKYVTVVFACGGRLSPAIAIAQRSDWPSTAMPPLVLRDTRPDEWTEQRSRIEARLKLYLGERPPAALTTSPTPEASPFDIKPIWRDKMIALVVTKACRRFLTKPTVVNPVKFVSRTNVYCVICSISFTNLEQKAE